MQIQLCKKRSHICITWKLRKAVPYQVLTVKVIVACTALQICAQSNWIALLFLLLAAQAQYANALWKWKIIDFGGPSRIWSFIMLGTESIYNLVVRGGTVCGVQLMRGPTSTWCNLLCIFTAKKPWFARLLWKTVNSWAWRGGLQMNRFRGVGLSPRTLRVLFVLLE